MQTPAPQWSAWKTQAPTSSPFTISWQQMFWEHRMAPQKRQRTGCFRSSSADRGHLQREGHIQCVGKARIRSYIYLAVKHVSITYPTQQRKLLKDKGYLIRWLLIYITYRELKGLGKRLQRTWVHSNLTTACDDNSTGSDDLFWPPWTFAYMRHKHTYT